MKMIINGENVDSVSGASFDVINPATGAVVDSVPKANEKDLDIAITAAVEAQKGWAKTPTSDRAAIMYKFLDIVKENEEELAQLFSAENGKPIKEARIEVRNIGVASLSFIERSKHYYGEIIPPGSENGHSRNLQLVTREPVGVVACVIPFNSPCNLFSQKVTPALLMGNSAIVLPSSDNPLTLMRLTQMVIDAGAPAGVVQCVTAPGSVKGAVVKDPRVGLVSFTGSTEIGIDTAKNAADNLTRVALELGGNDAFILLDDGDVDLAVEELVPGRMYNTGQICCASKRFLIHNSVKEEFTQKAIARIKQLKYGDPSEEDTDIACLISEKAARNVEAQVELTVKQGGRIVLGGKRDGAFYEPTVITDIPKTADVARDMEIFGPVVSIIGFDTDEEAVEIANNTKYGLSGCVFSNDYKRAYKIAGAVESGECVINGTGLYRSFEMPFGGWKQSGIGTEGVLTTFDEMTRIKTIVLKRFVE